MRIFLVGFMGSGKTTIGKKLARQMKFTFIDQDDYIEQMAGRSIPEIFDTDGEQGFRKLEHDAIKELVKKDYLIVATGGGAPCFFNNMHLYNQNGITIYLKMTPEILTARLKYSAIQRPLIKNKTTDELLAFVETSLHKREKYYQQATFIIEGFDLKVEDILNVLGLK